MKSLAGDKTITIPFDLSSVECACTARLQMPQHSIVGSLGRLFQQPDEEERDIPSLLQVSGEVSGAH